MIWSLLAIKIGIKSARIAKESGNVWLIAAVETSLSYGIIVQ